MLMCYFLLILVLTDLGLRGMGNCRRELDEPRSIFIGIYTGTRASAVSLRWSEACGQRRPRTTWAASKSTTSCKPPGLLSCFPPERIVYRLRNRNESRCYYATQGNREKNKRGFNRKLYSKRTYVPAQGGAIDSGAKMIEG